MPISRLSRPRNLRRYSRSQQLSLSLPPAPTRMTGSRTSPGKPACKQRSQSVQFTSVSSLSRTARPQSIQGLIMDLQAFTCRNDGCDGPRSGVCINSLPFDECPDVISVERSEGEPPEQAGPRPPAETVKTPGGRSLDAAHAMPLLRERGGTMIGSSRARRLGKRR